MKVKYDKYWGSVERINKLIFIAVVLDPLYKLDYISFCFSNIYEDAMAKVMVDGIKNYFIRLYAYYKFYDNAQDHHQSESRLTSKSMSIEMNTIDEENLSGSILVLSRYKRRREEQYSLELMMWIDIYLTLAKNLMIILMFWHGGKQMSLNIEFYRKLPKMFWPFQCRLYLLNQHLVWVRGFSILLGVL